MKYIITGGLGFIGSHLYEKLKNNGENILIIDNLYSGVKDNIKKLNHNDFIEDDVRNKNIEKYFEKDDVVIHLAAISPLPVCQSNPSLAYDVNVLGTINILEICRKKNLRLIFASTSAVYENTEIFPSKEGHEVNPTLIYSLTKMSCEKLCESYIKNYSMNITIIRFFNVYGGNQDFRRVSPPLTVYIMNELYNNKVPILHSDGKQKRDYIYIEDLLNFIILILNKDDLKHNIFNACSNTLISVNDIFNLIKRYMNKNIEAKYIESKNFWNKYSELYEGNKLKEEIIEKEVNKLILGDNTLSKKILNWDIKYNMEDGIKDMINKFKQKKQKLIMWDCDGVLVDSETLLKKGEKEELNKAGYNLSINDCVMLFSGLSIENATINFEAKYGPLPQDFFKKQIKNSFNLFRKRLTALNYNNVKKIFEKGINQCIVSGSPNERVKLCIEVTNMSSFFDEKTIFTKELVKNGKPSPELFLYAAEKMGYKPSDGLVIEDSPSGIQAAINAKMNVIAFMGGGHTRSDEYRNKIKSFNVPIVETEIELQEYL